MGKTWAVLAGLLAAAAALGTAAADPRTSREVELT
jgi:hypothetical protein